MKKLYFSLSMWVTITVAFSSCSNSNDGPENIPDAKAIVIKPEYEVKTINNRSFALGLFKTIAAESGGENFFISPYNVNTALSMAWNGAGGETETEMRETLGNGNYTKTQINDYAKALTDALLNVDPTTDLKIANSIWADKSTPFKPSFTETNRVWYNAEVRNVNFSKQETFDVIDKWCRENTGNKIDKISESMSTDTKFALINAIYFKGKWRYKFDKSNTKEETFTNSDGTQSMVQMMNQTETFQYTEDDNGWKMLKLPYGNQAFSMVLLMPSANEPLDAKLGSLTADGFYALLNNMRNSTISVKLPKFKAEYSYMLHDAVLPAMGMKRIFNPLQADLSEMCDAPMFVNCVLHKTYIDVYEEGSEAAAVTVVSSDMTSVGPTEIPVFYANRPFVYTIVENSTGTILFMGRINHF